MIESPQLEEAGRRLAETLRRVGRRLVLAESCTAGLVSATLARTPGISELLCGSFVVYRIDSKARWIDVPESILKDPGPVSHVVAVAMATGALRRTPEASLALSVTGHLGPNAPTDQDGLCFVGWHDGGVSDSQPVWLEAEDRVDRQVEAAVRLLERAVAVLS